MDEDERVDLVGLQNRLGQATYDYEKAVERTADARREETRALNELNEVQREFDQTVNRLKKSAPTGSDWWEEFHG